MQDFFLDILNSKCDIQEDNRDDYLTKDIIKYISENVEVNKSSSNRNRIGPKTKIILKIRFKRKFKKLRKKFKNLRINALAEENLFFHGKKQIC